MASSLSTENQTHPSEHASRTPSQERLAVYGGPRAVTVRRGERWRPIRALDILKIAMYAARGISTRFGSRGPVASLETGFKQLTKTKYALAMNSGTAALHSAYFAVGVKPGDEVIVPSYTFFASAAPILQCGGTPVFCEIDPQTLTADPDDVERRITPRTRAICVVHLWGTPARMDRFVEIAKRHGVALIEDASHAHGATYQGRPVGSWGDVGCFSLQGTKAVSGGEAGIATTNDPTLFDRMLALGHFSRLTTDQQAATFQIGDMCLGLKYRPHLYAMILARGSLSRLPELNQRRRHNYQILVEELADCKAIQTVESYPDTERGGMLEWALIYDSQYAGGWPREAFVKAASAEGVPIHVDRYPPLHKEALFSTTNLSDCGGYIGYAARNRPTDQPEQHLPITEQICSQTLFLDPLTKVSERYVRQCAAALRKVADGASVIRDFRTGN